MQTDDEFYRLATEFPRAVVGLLAGAEPAGAYAMKSLTFKDVERRLDLGFEPERPQDDWWLVEAAGYEDAEVERRLFGKVLRAADDYGLWGKLRSGVIYVREGLAKKALPPCLGPPGVPVNLQPVRVFLDTLSPRQLLGISPGLFPLLPLCRVSSRGLRSHLGRWWNWVTRRLGGSQKQQEEQRDLLCRFYLARHPDAILKELRQVMEKIMRIEHTRAGQELIEIGKEQGIQIGEQRGIQIGEQRARVDSIQRVLTSRFGAVPPQILERLESAGSLGDLGRLLDAALAAPDLATFAARL